MKLFINTDIKIRKRLHAAEKQQLRNFSIWHNTKRICVQKCTVPEDVMQELIDVLQLVSKKTLVVQWVAGKLEIN